MRGIKREAIKNMAQMDSVLARIKSGEINVVVIDTIDELVNNFAKDEVRQIGGDYVFKGQLTVAGWGLMRDRFLRMTRSFRDAGADVLTICHSELVEKPNGGKKWSMKLPSDYAREVMGMMDVIGFMEVHRNGDGSQVYRLNLEKTPMYDAGYRAIYDAGADKFFRAIPPVIDDPALIDILSAYDAFFDGKSNGFTVPCHNPNCEKNNGKVQDAQVETAGMMLCDDCDKRYKEIHSPKATA